MVFQSAIRTGDADQLFGAIIIGRQILIRDGPVRAESVAALALEVIRTEARHMAAPVIGAPAQHARAPPAEGRTRRGGVGLARHLPAAASGGVVIAESLVRRGAG